MEQHDESLMQTNTQHFVLVQPGVELPAVKQLCDRAKGNDLKALSYSASPADSGKVGSFKFNVPPANMAAEIVFVLNIWQQLWDGLNVLTKRILQDGTAFAQHLPIFIVQPL